MILSPCECAKMRLKTQPKGHAACQSLLYLIGVLAVMEVVIASGEKKSSLINERFPPPLQQETGKRKEHASDNIYIGKLYVYYVA